MRIFFQNQNLSKNNKNKGQKSTQEDTEYRGQGEYLLSFVITESEAENMPDLAQPKPRQNQVIWRISG